MLLVQTKQTAVFRGTKFGSQQDKFVVGDYNQSDICPFKSERNHRRRKTRAASDVANANANHLVTF